MLDESNHGLVELKSFVFDRSDQNCRVSNEGWDQNKYSPYRPCPSFSFTPPEKCWVRVFKRIHRQKIKTYCSDNSIQLYFRSWSLCACLKGISRTIATKLDRSNFHCCIIIRPKGLQRDLSIYLDSLYPHAHCHSKVNKQRRHVLRMFAVGEHFYFESYRSYESLQNSTTG